MGILKSRDAVIHLMIHLALASFAFGVAAGMCISRIADGAELAAYRRISRMASERAARQVEE